MELVTPHNRLSSEKKDSASYIKLVEDVDRQENGDSGESGGNFSEAIEASGFGKFHVILLLVCGFANMSDAVEVLSVSFLLPDASRDLHITSAEEGLLTSIIFVGLLVGGYVWGCLADVLGRRQVLIWSLGSNALFALISSFCQNFWLFLVMKFLSGIGVGGNIPLIFAYFGEFQPARHRGKMISAVSTCWMGGTILTAALAWAIIPRDIGYHRADGFSYESWRIFVAVCCVPSATSVITFLLMPESPRYLLEKGEREKALDIMKKIFCLNNKGAKASDYPIDHLIPSGREDTSLLIGDRQWKCYPQCFRLSQSTLQLFQHPLTGTSLAMLTVVFSLSFGYYGLFMWFPELFTRVEFGGSACSSFNISSVSSNSSEVKDLVYTDAFFTALASLPGCILSMAIMDILRRKYILSSSMVISGASVFLIWFLHTRTHVLIVSCLFGAISMMCWSTFNVLNVELYPTSCRSTALGVMSGANRTGAIVGNLLFGILIDLNCAVPMILIAVLFGVGGIVALVLPKTSNTELK